MSEDMSKLMGQLSNMLNSNEMPEEIKNMIKGLQASKENNSSATLSNNSKNAQDAKAEDTSSDASMPEFDINMMLKMKQIMDSLGTRQDDPRANLLRSLKPYLKESRKEKVDQYIQIFGMGKVFEMLNPLGGEKKNDV